MADHADLGAFLAPLRAWAEAYNFDGPFAIEGDDDARLIVYRGFVMVRGIKTSITGRIDVDALRVDAVIGNKGGLEVYADGSIITYGQSSNLLGDLRDRFLASDQRFKRGSRAADHARDAHAAREQASYLEGSTRRFLE